MLTLLFIFIFKTKDCKIITKISGYNNIYYTTCKAPYLFKTSCIYATELPWEEWEFHNG